MTVRETGKLDAASKNKNETAGDLVQTGTLDGRQGLLLVSESRFPQLRMSLELGSPEFEVDR